MVSADEHERVSAGLVTWGAVTLVLIVMGWGITLVLAEAEGEGLTTTDDEMGVATGNIVLHEVVS